MATILLNKIRIGSKSPKAIYKGSTEVKCAYKGSTLVYDTQKSSTTTNRFSVSYASNYLPNTAGSTPAPSITKGYDTVAIGYSGNSYNLGFTSVSSTVSFQYSSFAAPQWGNGDVGNDTETTWGSLNSSTGVVTYSYNRWPTSRDVTITAKATINGTSMTSSNILTQLAGQKLTVYLYTSSFGGPGGAYEKGYFFANTSYMSSTMSYVTPQYYYTGSYYDIHEYGVSSYPSLRILDQYGSWIGDPMESMMLYIYKFYRQYSYDTYSTITLDGSVYIVLGDGNNYTYSIY